MASNELQALIRQRGARRVLATRYICAAVDETKKGPDADSFKLCGLKKQLEMVKLDIDKFDSQICLLCPEDELATETEKAADYQENLYDAIGGLEASLTAIQVGVPQGGNLVPNTGPYQDKRMLPKLPTLQIPLYSGDPLKWQTFWDAYESSIHMSDRLSEVDKFNYLCGLLAGDAKRAIEGLPITNATYSVAVDTIKSRFGRKQMVIHAHVEKLISLPDCAYDTSKLRWMFDECERHIRCLDALGVSEDKFDLVFVPVILSKLPREVRLDLNRKNGMSDWKLATLRKLLQEEVLARELTGTGSADKGTKGSPQFTRRRTTDSLVANTKTKPLNCFFCREAHFTDECKQVSTISERKTVVVKENRCFICFKRGHGSKSCQSKQRCFYCNGLHHRSLCFKQFGGNMRRQSGSRDLVGTISGENNYAYGGGNIRRQGSSRDVAGIISDENSPIKQNSLAQHTATTTSMLAPGQNVLLALALVTVCGTCHARPFEAHAILDSGSQRSYITTAVMQRLNLVPVGYENLSVTGFGAETMKFQRAPTVEVLIKGVNGFVKKMIVTVVPTITAPIRKYALNQDKMSVIKTLQLAVPVAKITEDVTVEILIGGDYYFSIVQSERIDVTSDLVVLHTTFGWVPTGKIESDMVSQSATGSRSWRNEAHSLVAATHLEPYSEAQFAAFWNLEAIGIRDDGQICDDDMAVQKFNESVQFTDGRYQVRWPWKEEDPNLPENYELALGRLKSLHKRIKDSPAVMKKYDGVIQEQLTLGIAEEVTSSSIEAQLKHYIPHHCVIREDKATTKLRVVYDASARSRKENCSLNDCLYRGPVLLQNLCGLLLRFRLPKIVLIGDIEKAFLQVGLQMPDRDVTRFLWFKDLEGSATPENLRVLRFCRVPFGVISSPFLLSATIEHHLKSLCRPSAAEILRGIYVDNVLCGRGTATEALEFYSEAKDMFRQASMNLREWCSNSIEFMGKIPEVDRVKQSVVKVLGLNWDTQTDEIYLPQVQLNPSSSITKRVILQSVSMLFDPLGLFAAVTVRAKMLIQRLWKDHLEWDVPVSETVKQSWTDIRSDLEKVSVQKLPRLIGYAAGAEVEIHVFCDASSLAYGACAYLKASGEVSLLMCKNRLAPIKAITIPRLELMALVMGVRLLQFIEQQLDIAIARRYIWSDSKCVLYWVLSEQLQPVFVENRLKEIRGVKNVKFRYVSTMDNPADYPTRGKTATDIECSELWWKGPQWLAKDEKEWPVWKPEKNKPPTSESRISPVQAVCTTVQTTKLSPFGIDLSKYSTLTRLIRVTAYCGRFVNRVRCSAAGFTTAQLSSVELAEAMKLWVKSVQDSEFGEVLRLLRVGRRSDFVDKLGLFLNSEGIIRCSTRLDNAELNVEAKYPLLLPKNNRFTRLVIGDCHKRLLHAGASHTLSELRQKYWVVCGRKQVVSALKDCLVCRKWNGQSYNAKKIPMLPKERVVRGAPFETTGVDYFGPLHVAEHKDDKSKEFKAWICLFTCGLVRALHLEVVRDLTAEEFLACFRRFVARRGRPKIVYSDNAKAFKLSSKALTRLWANVISDESVQGYTATNGIEWKFIPASAAWMGGFYERLIGMVKKCLKKTIGRSKLTYFQLVTVVTEIEGLLNSRPIVYVGADLNDGPALTPNHFLGQFMKAGIPKEPKEIDPDYTPDPRPDPVSRLLLIWKKGERVLDLFWQRWRSEYLTALRERTDTQEKQGSPNRNPQVDDVVLIEGAQMRGNWRMGKITKLIISRDKLVRSAYVKLGNGACIHRPIKHLYPLEYSGFEKTEE